MKLKALFELINWTGFVFTELTHERDTCGRRVGRHLPISGIKNFFLVNAQIFVSNRKQDFVHDWIRFLDMTKSH